MSLGQGQEVVAEDALDVAAETGHWVILQVRNASGYGHPPGGLGTERQQVVGFTVTGRREAPTPSSAPPGPAGGVRCQGAQGAAWALRW